MKNTLSLLEKSSRKSNQYEKKGKFKNFNRLNDQTRMQKEAFTITSILEVN